MASAASVRVVLAGAVALAGLPFLSAHAHEVQGRYQDSVSLKNRSGDVAGNSAVRGDETAFAVARPVNAGFAGSMIPLAGEENDADASSSGITGLNDGIMHDEITLPHPLSALAAARYRSVFRAVREGDFQAAEAHIALLQDDILLSDVLAERYLHSESRPRVEDLQDWLRAYPYSPDLPAMAALLGQIQPSLAASLPRNHVHVLMRGEVIALSNNDSNAAFSQAFTRNNALEHNLQDQAARGIAGARNALRQISHMPGVNNDYSAQLHGEVALALLSQGNALEALRIGSQGFAQGGQRVGFPAYVAGLAAWHEGRMEAAYLMFEAAANAVVTEGDVQAAASFWAARVETIRHHDRKYHLWLRRAATHNASFYGLLAARLLERDRDDNSTSGTGGDDMARLTNSSLSANTDTASIGNTGAENGSSDNLSLGEVDVEAVMSMAEGRHLFALLQLDEQGRAEALMRRMWPDIVVDPVRARSLQLVARYSGMTELAGQMNQSLELLNHQNMAQGATPMPHLKPQNGFHFNPALVYAVAWTESNFNARATSPVGAMGMMQIRPRTASFVTSKHITYAHGVAVVPVPSDLPQRLCDPAYNLEVGQRYMMYLADAVSRAGGADTGEGGDLLRVIASYNAGPQAIMNWENLQDKQHDPLYFVETLPNTETRNYVHRVMTASWLYARRMGLGAPSLGSLSEARWPSFRQEQEVHDTPS